MSHGGSNSSQVSYAKATQLNLLVSCTDASLWLTVLCLRPLVTAVLYSFFFVSSCFLLIPLFRWNLRFLLICANERDRLQTSTQCTVRGRLRFSVIWLWGSSLLSIYSSIQTGSGLPLRGESLGSFEIPRESSLGCCNRDVKLYLLRG